MFTGSGIKAKIDAFKRGHRNINMHRKLNTANADPVIDHQHVTPALSPTTWNLSSLPTSEVNPRLPTGSRLSSFKPSDLSSSIESTTKRHHPKYSEVCRSRRGSEGQAFFRDTWCSECARLAFDREDLELRLNNQKESIAELQNTVDDQRIEYCRLERTVKLGCGKLLRHVLRLWRCYAAKEKELEHARVELAEASKNNRVLDAYCRERKKVVGLLMAEKEEWKARCGELEGKIGEREEGTDMLLATNEEGAVRCEELEGELAEEQGRKFMDMETWCRLHGWEKKKVEGREVETAEQMGRPGSVLHGSLRQSLE